MPEESEPPKKLKPCCACPETRKARDAWYESFNLITDIDLLCN